MVVGEGIFCLKSLLFFCLLLFACMRKNLKKFDRVKHSSLNSSFITFLLLLDILIDDDDDENDLCEYRSYNHE